MKKKVVIKPPKDHDTCRSCSYQCRKLRSISVSEMAEKLFRKLRFEKKPETIPVANAVDRVTYETIYSINTVPNGNRAMKDGIFINYERIRTEYGDDFTGILIDDFEIAPMGSVMIGNYDTMLHAEQAIFLNGKVKILETPVLNQCVTWQGHMMEIGDKIIEESTRLKPWSLSCIAMSGHSSIRVIKKPVVAILPVGNELVPPGEIRDRKTVDSNSIFVKALLEKMGAEAEICDIQKDDLHLLKSSIKEIIDDFDLVVTIGGVGKGGEEYTDFVPKAIEAIGEIVQHGALLSPGGSPSLYGIVNEKIIIGIPGPPHACLVQAEYLLQPIFDRYYGTRCNEYGFVDAIVMEKFAARGETEFYIHADLRWEEGEYRVYQLNDIGDGVDNFVRATGQIYVPPHTDREVGETVKVKLLCDERILNSQLYY